MPKESQNNHHKRKKQDKESLLQRIDNYLLRFSRVPLKEKLFFLQYFSIMIRAGLPLSVILKTLARQTSNKRFTLVINDIKNRVEKGGSLAESFRVHEDIFGELFVNMIEAGETSGSLEAALNQLYKQTKKKNELISKVKGALTYPAFVILIMIIVGVVMMVNVVPKLTGMLKNFDTELPLATRVLMAISDFIINNGLLLSIFLVLLLVSFYFLLQTYKGKYYFQYLLLKLPVVSSIDKKINLARFARTLSGLLKSDILITRSFRITSNVISNLHYKEAVDDMADKVEKGYEINQVISGYTSLFPPIVHEVVSVGEKTGELDDMLLELAEFYEYEVDSIMDNLPSIIEPILILILGVGVGAMAIAVIMPMYTLTSTI
jgi:type IV pilus assembly protein PilC